MAIIMANALALGLDFGELLTAGIGKVTGRLLPVLPLPRSNQAWGCQLPGWTLQPPRLPLHHSPQLHRRFEKRACGDLAKSWAQEEAIKLRDHYLEYLLARRALLCGKRMRLSG